MAKLLFWTAFVAVLSLVEPHGYLKTPLARTSIFREPKYNTAQPYWWDDTEPRNGHNKRRINRCGRRESIELCNGYGVWCGNDPQDLQYSTCGRCGDASRGTTANQDGIYDKKVITGTYISGSRITVEVEITAAHYGFFEIELCAQETETDDCFKKLPILSGSKPLREGTLCVGIDSQLMKAEVDLPAGVTCNRCTLRWTWRTSYGAVQGDPDWNPCYNYKPAQTFRNCADIRIQTARTLLWELFLG